MRNALAGCCACAALWQDSANMNIRYDIAIGKIMVGSYSSHVGKSQHFAQALYAETITVGWPTQQ